MEESKQPQPELSIRTIAHRLQLLTTMSRTHYSNVLSSFVGSLLRQSGPKTIPDELKNLDVTPQIVFIGKTGVGKSSTLNRLFNPEPNLPVDHVEPATVSIEVLTLSLGERGQLVVVDCPGLGESKEADRRNMRAYRQLLAQSDVAVWIMKADDRSLGVDQDFIRQVLPNRLRSKLVVGINQVDSIQPGEWSAEYNLPSKEQDVSIGRKEAYVSSRLKEIGIEPFAIVSYSAKRMYRLTKLFRAMVEACPTEKVPSLVRRGDSRSYLSNDLQKKLEANDESVD